MEASVNATATPTPVKPSIPATPAPAAAPPAAPGLAYASPATRRPKRRNWNMIIRVGLVGALVFALIGYALKVTYESVIQGGVVASGDHFNVELKQMSNFEMDQLNGTVADVPQRYRELDGKRIMLVGEVAPGGMSAGDLTRQFSLCYSVAKCCFGGPPKIQHFVLCTPADGKPMPNYDGSGPVKVYGKLSVKVIKDDTGKISSLFQMSVDRIEPVS
jgi:hypothetical protein